MRLSVTVAVSLKTLNRIYPSGTATQEQHKVEKSRMPVVSTTLFPLLGGRHRHGDSTSLEEVFPQEAPLLLDCVVSNAKNLYSYFIIVNIFSQTDSIQNYLIIHGGLIIIKYVKTLFHVTTRRYTRSTLTNHFHEFYVQNLNIIHTSTPVVIIKVAYRQLAIYESPLSTYALSTKFTLHLNMYDTEII